MEIGLLHHTHWIDKRYEYARDTDTWVSLIPYPCLLLRWQSEEKGEVKRIATLMSHMRGRHIWCQEKCLVIDQWIRRQLVAALVFHLKTLQTHTPRPLL